MAKKIFTDESLATLISEIRAYVDEAVLDKANASALNNYYTKTQIDNMELITTADIDTICGVFNYEDEALNYLDYNIDSTAKQVTLNSISYDDLYTTTGSYDVTIPNKIGGYDVVIANG